MLLALLLAVVSTVPECPEGTTPQTKERETTCVGADGLANGPYWRVYPDGSIAERGQFAAGKRIGVWERLHPNGVVASRVEYVNDARAGEYKSFDDAGRVLQIGQYEDGKKVGRWFSRQVVRPEEGPPNELLLDNLSGTSRLLPIQAGVSMARHLGTEHRNHLKFALYYARGTLEFNRAGFARARYLGFGFDGELAVLNDPCEMRCPSGTIGPSFRYGLAQVQLPANAESIPTTIAPDVYVYGQLTPRFVMLEGPPAPLEPARRGYGLKLEFGGTVLGSFADAQTSSVAMNLAGRSLVGLLGLATQSLLVLSAALSNHGSLWAELYVPEGGTPRLLGGIAFGFGL